MVTIFSKLHDAIKKEAEAVGLVKKRTINKRNFADDLKILIGRYQNVIGSVGAMPTTDLQQMADRIYTHKTDSNCPGCSAYIAIATEVKAKNDHKIAFDSMIMVSKAIENVLANFAANVDVIFDGAQDVNIHTAKLSHLACFGFVENAEMYIEYLVSLLSVITYEIIENNGVREIKKPLPYKYEYIKNHTDQFIQFHHSMLNGGNRTYLDTFKSLKKSMDDVRVSNADTGSNIEMIDDNKLLQLSHGLFGQFSLNPFKWLGEQWTLIRNCHYMKMASEREDLIAHVNLLQMDLANKDPNSPEYAKMVKVIDSYNEMIGKLNQKLEKYYGPKEDNN